MEFLWNTYLSFSVYTISVESFLTAGNGIKGVQMLIIQIEKEKQDDFQQQHMNDLQGEMDSKRKK